MENINNKEWLNQIYVIENKGSKFIAKICNCSCSTVLSRLRSFDIPIKKFSEGIRNIPKGEAHCNWNGGFWINSDGYIKVAKPKDHPCKSRYVFLHRLIIEKKIGRYLEQTEVIHHKDGNKQNNAEENLELFLNQSKHAKEGLVSRRIHKKLWLEGWLKEEYETKTRTLNDIALEIGCKEGTVRNALNRLGIKRRRFTMTEKAMEKRRKGARAKKPRNVDYSSCSEEYIREEYINKNRSFRSIGEEIGWHKNKVKNYILKLGIEIRSHKQQTTIQNKILKLSP